MNEPKKPDRTPIAITKLIFTSSQPQGVNLPWGSLGESIKQQPQLIAGIHGSELVSIEWRPWMRMYRVTRSRKNGATWERSGAAFMIPETWAVAVIVDD